MIFEPRRLEKINDDIKSGGQSFIGMHIEDILSRIPELEDRNNKKMVIKEYFDNQQCFYDSDIGGTRIRVNAVIRIIKANQVKYVLEKIDGSNPLVAPEAVERAQSLLRRIENGQFLLPSLDGLAR